MKLDAQARYTKTHEWARREGDEVVIGITDYAQSTLSDIVYVDLPDVGDSLTAGESLGVVESVKAAADVIAPVSGEVVAVNETLADAPETLNTDPFGAGWLVRVVPSDWAEFEALMDADAYAALVASLEH